MTRLHMLANAIAAVLLLSLTGCSDESTAEELSASTLTATYSDRSFRPRFGFFAEDSAFFDFSLATNLTSCDGVQHGLPHEGTNVLAGIPEAATGIFATNFFFGEGVGDYTQVMGTIEVTAIDGLEVTATFDASETIDAAKFELRGSATFVRCP